MTGVTIPGSGTGELLQVRANRDRPGSGRASPGGIAVGVHLVQRHPGELDPCLGRTRRGAHGCHAYPASAIALSSEPAQARRRKVAGEVGKSADQEGDDEKNAELARRSVVRSANGCRENLLKTGVVHTSPRSRHLVVLEVEDTAEPDGAVALLRVARVAEQHLTDHDNVSDEGDVQASRQGCGFLRFSLRSRHEIPTAARLLCTEQRRSSPRRGRLVVLRPPRPVSHATHVARNETP